MPTSLVILMAQCNPIVGAIHRNTQHILEIIEKNQVNYDLIIFPELALTGYPLEDLLLRPALFIEISEALEHIRATAQSCHVLIGHPFREGVQTFNAASLFYEGEFVTRYYKHHLPNYGVFDEKRYFTSGPLVARLFKIKGYHIGMCICEDLWHQGPVETLIEAGVDIIVSINASPFESEKHGLRLEKVRSFAKNGVIFVYVNQVGGQDELLFDGQSFVIDSNGALVSQAPAFKEALHPVIIHTDTVESTIITPLSSEALLYHGLMCGIHDYVEKNHFPGVVLGLSGGIDSALTLALSVAALGPERVHTLMLPSEFTADISIHDAAQQAYMLGGRHDIIPIHQSVDRLSYALQPVCTPRLSITNENLQARTRAVLLMGVSNNSGYLLLSTSNKSEVAVGFSTLYGDTCGGYAPLKDVLKTQVYALANYSNTLGFMIPERVITRPPSAELAENQTDQDRLPDYPTLDAIIAAYIRDNLSAIRIAEQGYPLDTVERVLAMIQRSEYKRRQSPPGPKVSSYAFGREWRYPITAIYEKK